MKKLIFGLFVLLGCSKASDPTACYKCTATSLAKIDGVAFPAGGSLTEINKCDMTASQASSFAKSLESTTTQHIPTVDANGNVTTSTIIVTTTAFCVKQ